MNCRENAFVRLATLESDLHHMKSKMNATADTPSQFNKVSHTSGPLAVQLTSEDRHIVGMASTSVWSQSFACIKQGIHNTIFLHFSHNISTLLTQHLPAQRMQLEADIPKLEGAVAMASSEHIRISELNDADLADLRSQMSRDLVSMLREFVLIQVASSQKTAQLWEEAVASLKQ